MYSYNTDENNISLVRFHQIL